MVKKVMSDKWKHDLLQMWSERLKPRFTSWQTTRVAWQGKSKAWLEHNILPQWQRLPKLHRIALSVLVPLLLVLLLLPWGASDSLPDTGKERVGVDIVLDDDATPPTENATPADDQSVNTDWMNYEVAKGDTLSLIFRQHDLPLPDLYAITKIEGSDKPLSRIQPGQLLRLKRTAAGELDMLQIETGGGESVIYFRLSDGSFARQQ